MPPPPRERYNSKARGSTAGGSSHKKRARTAGQSISGVVSMDAAPSTSSSGGLDIVVSKSEAEKEADRRAKLKQEVSRFSTDGLEGGRASAWSVLASKEACLP